MHSAEEVVHVESRLELPVSAEIWLATFFATTLQKPA